MKTVFAALVGAVGTTLACWRLILILWAVTASMAWLMSTPVRSEIAATFDHSPMSQGLLQAFDNEAFVDFWDSTDDPVGQSASLVRENIFAWIVLWTILSAGVLARVADKQRFDGFFSSCARFGHRFVWLLGLSLVGWWALSWFNDHLSSWVTSALIGDDNSSGASVLGWSMTLKSLFMLALVGIVVTAGRFARLRVVLLGERFVLASWLKALVSVVRHLPSIGLGRVLSLWPLVLAFFIYKWGTEAALSGRELIPGLRLEWHLVLVMQVSQMVLVAALVYRMAVDARLWTIVAPSEATPAVAAPANSPAATAPAASAEAPAGGEGSGAGGPQSSEGGSEVSDAAQPSGEPAESKQSPGSGSSATAFALALLAVAGLSSPLSAQEPADTEGATPETVSLSTHHNAYVMDVTVDVEARTVGGTNRATFINTTSEPVQDLWMHLYASAFSNTHTSWIQGGSEQDVRSRGEALGGYLNIQSVQLGDGTDLATDTNIRDTLMQVSLPQPVLPGERIEISIAFETRFPDVIARMGQEGRHIDGMQWFPKFCAHGEDGWKQRPFYRTGEFFADFGAYDVTFRYPVSIDEEALVLEATGMPGPVEQDGEGWVKQRFVAQDVHDFAFCADTAFERFESTFEDPITGRTVDIVYLCQPYAVPKAQQVLDAMQTFLRTAGEWWMPYPYPRVVIDGLPHSQGGGMEYPMLFTISQRFPNHLDSLVTGTEDPVSVTAHEFGHQYWYGILASDEVDEAWLDEGLNTWGTTELVEEHWPLAQETNAGQTDAVTFLDRILLQKTLNGGLRGALPFSRSPLSLQSAIGWTVSPFHNTPPGKPATKPTLLGFTMPNVGSQRLPDMSANRPAWWKSSYRKVASARPLSAPSREFTKGYGGLVYRKTALSLETLERHVGKPMMRDIMRTYVQRFAFQHPTGDDFIAVISEVTEGAHDTLMNQLLRTSGTVDWTVEEVKTLRVDPLEGFTSQQKPGDPITWVGSSDSAAEDDGKAKPTFQALWSFLFTTAHPLASAPAANADADADRGAPADPQDEPAPVEWLSKYVVRQLGTVEAPVEIRATFADGSLVESTWDGIGGYKHFEHRTSAKLTSVTVDPRRLFLIDLDVNNNGRVLQANHETTRALQAYSHFWTQNVLSGWSLIF